MLKKYFDLLKITFQEWNEDQAPRLAAALAYYTALSIAPLILVVIAILGFFFGDEAARGQIVGQFSNELGSEFATFIEDLIQNSDKPAEGLFSTILSLIMLIVGATGVLMQLQSALNQIWDIQVEGGLGQMVKKRFLSFGILMSLAFLLLISLVINGVIASLDQYLIGIMPALQILGHLITTLISLGVSTLLFAIIFKYMPDATIEWRDVMIGAFVTAILFTIGRFALGLYLGNVSTVSTYGAAGSFVIILLWVYYSAQILMFGAEFTQVYARRYGTRIVPEEGAQFVVQAPEEIASPEEVEKIIEDKAKNVDADIPDSVTATIEEAPKPDLASTTVIEKPIEIKDATVIHRERKEPEHTLIISSFVAVFGVVAGWLLRQIVRKD
ncbi:MAG: YihY/virulence factor BrkB family protein [Phototrophicaceae bacterium]